jgi:hypothetical protein
MRASFLATCCASAVGLVFSLGIQASDAVSVEDLPAKVKSTMTSAAAGAELTNVRKSTSRQGLVYYTAMYNKDGKTVDLAVSEDGKLVKKIGAKGESGKKKSSQSDP